MKKALSIINEALLKLEAEPENKNYLNQILSNTRSIKVCATFFELERIVGISTYMENVIDFLINSKNIINSDVIEVLILSIDYMSELSKSLISGKNVPKNNEIFNALEKILQIKVDPETETGNQLKVDEENLNDFLISANELLEVLERNIFEFEKNDSNEIVNEIFRVVHTLKSDSGYLGLKPIADYTHILESLLDKVRNKKITKNNKIVEIILKSADSLKIAISGLNPGHYESVKNLDSDALQKLINEIDSNKGESNVKNSEIEGASAFRSQLLQYKETILECAGELPISIERKKIITRSLHSMHSAALFVGQGKLAGEADSLLEKIDNDSWAAFTQQLPVLVKRIDEILEDTLNVKKVTEKDSASDNINIPKQGPDVSIENEIRTMRVDEHKIDHFTNLIGELLIAKNTYEYILNEFSVDDSSGNKYRKQLKDNLYLFARLSNELQSGVMSLRMVPVKGIFQKFSRVIRDISKKQTKKIELITIGNETEVDKKVADALSEPLIHIIRNSCDHGIEQMDVRKRKHKPEKGTITLNASQEGSDLIIKISDDGCGINRENLIQKAEKMGFNTDKYDDDKILNLIFEPGLSTKTEVSDLSGRGVGMDVVKNTIKKLNGDIKVISKDGVGTEITLKVPMSIGVSESLLVEAVGNIYAIPLDYITETLKLESNKLVRIHDRLGFNFRGEIFPADYLDNLLNTDSGMSDSDYIYKTNLEKDGCELSVVIVKTKKGKFGIIIDKLIRNVELSIKQVPESLSNIELISGVSILGDGKVVLVLNPEKLV